MLTHSPVRTTVENSASSQSSRGDAPQAELSFRQGGGSHFSAAGQDATSVEAVSICRLPPFWRAKPDLWFVQAEAALQLSRVRGDDTKYNLVLSMLDPDTLCDIEDIICSPPDTERYATLKNAILSRLTDSADRQLLRLFTQLELGDRKPSQLLRHMRGLSAGRVSDDVLRVKWLDLLPMSVQRLLRILKTSALEELAAVADEIADATPGVAAAAAPDTAAITTPLTSRDSLMQSDCLVSELESIKFSLAQLIAINRDILARLDSRDQMPCARPAAPSHRSRSRSRPASVRPTGGATYISMIVLII